jgi:uncharacterized oligopeptide transporter (OPT) family protein
MAIHELSDEQIRTMSLEEKDRWWLKSVYKGDMPQLTIRSAVTGMVLGGVLCLTNLYVGIRTGWTLGVGITSVILSFAAFKVLSKLGVGKEMTVLENNAMQSIATSAGYATSALTSFIPTYMLVTHQVIPAYFVWAWIIVLPTLGVLFAFPLKKRFINDEQLRFPEGYAAGIVMDNLHTGKGEEGLFKAKLLAIAAGASAFIEFWRNEAIFKAIKLHALALPEHVDDFIYKHFPKDWWPKILGTPLKDLTVQMDTSIVLVGAGGIMGTKTGLSMFVGAIVNYFILAPILIQKGIITGVGFKNISIWALWGGAAMMTTASLYSFFSRPKIILDALRAPFSKKKAKSDVLADIELPMWISVVGIPILGILVAFMGNAFFGMGFWLGLVAIPIVFILTLIAVYSTGLTSITPGSAIGKLTQLTYSFLAPGHIQTNVMAASISSEVSLSASNLLMDIKPGYMLGAKPRQQAVGHILGAIAGATCAVPVFYLIFNGDVNLFTSDRLPMPSVITLRGVAELLMKGIGFLHPTARWAVVIGAFLGILFEYLNNRLKGKFPISGVGVGLGFILRFTDTLAMSGGSFLFWFLNQKLKNPKTTTYKVFIDNQESVCAGVIAGGSIIGIALIVIETVFLS